MMMRFMMRKRRVSGRRQNMTGMDLRTVPDP